MSAYLKQIGTSIGIFAVSAAAAYASGSPVVVGIGTAAIMGAIFASPQRSTLLQRCREVYEETLTKVRRFSHWRPFTVVQMGAIILSSGVGIYVMHQPIDGAVALCNSMGICAMHQIGYRVARTIAGASIGALPVIYQLNQHGVIRPMDPPPPIPDRFEIAPGSLLHLNGSCHIGVYYGDTSRDYNPDHEVCCSSAAMAIECDKLIPWYRKEHKLSFFQRMGRGPEDCLAFTLARPLAEIDPHFDLGARTEFYTRMKFGVAFVASYRIRPPLKPEQQLCRNALAATNEAAIIYPAMQCPYEILAQAKDLAVAQVLRPEVIASFIHRYQTYMSNPVWAAAIGNLGITPLDLEKAAQRGARIGANGGATTVLIALMEAEQVPAGVLFDGAYYGADAGVLERFKQVLRIDAYGLQMYQQPLHLNEAIRMKGVQMGQQIVTALPTRTPILVDRGRADHSPVDMACLLTNIRTQILREGCSQQVEDAHAAAGIPPPPRLPSAWRS